MRMLCAHRAFLCRPPGSVFAEEGDGRRPGQQRQADQPGYRAGGQGGGTEPGGRKRPQSGEGDDEDTPGPAPSLPHIQMNTACRTVQPSNPKATKPPDISSRPDGPPDFASLPPEQGSRDQRRPGRSSARRRLSMSREDRLSRRSSRGRRRPDRAAPPSG